MWWEKTQRLGLETGRKINEEGKGGNKHGNSVTQTGNEGGTPRSEELESAKLGEGRGRKQKGKAHIRTKRDGHQSDKPQNGGTAEGGQNRKGGPTVEKAKICVKTRAQVGQPNF